jgi:hypothetical protein
MRIAHWSDKALPSGLGETANHICAAERKLGMDSVVIDAQRESDWVNADGADVHVIHLFMPPKVIHKTKAPFVWVSHGTPEVMSEGSIVEASKGGYGPADGWMIAQWWLQHADVTVTFWPRHEAIWKSLCDKNTRVEGVPLGVDRDFWKPIESAGKFAGEPSVFSAENCYMIKWPWDLIVAWPWVVANGFSDAKLHLVNVPYDQSRVWWPLMNRNGSGYHAYLTNRRFSPDELRHAFASTDYFCGLVRYGDVNYLALQANACGAKTISYKGNPYSDYHVDFGDQRILANQLLAIMRGEVEAREKEPVPSILRTADRLRDIYLSLAKDTVIIDPKVLAPKKRKRKIIPKDTSLATLTVQ